MTGRTRGGAHRGATDASDCGIHMPHLMVFLRERVVSPRPGTLTDGCDFVIVHAKNDRWGTIGAA